MEAFYLLPHFTPTLLESEENPPDSDELPGSVATSFSELVADKQARLHLPAAIWPYITNDRHWHRFAPERPEEDHDLFDILVRAFHHPLTGNNNENIARSLDTLSRLGLVPEPDHHVSLGSYICCTILNYGLVNNQPCPFHFTMCMTNEISIEIPSRSRLLLLYFADLFKVNIFLFSSRRSPDIFPCHGTTSSIAIFHRISSYFSTSEYLPLFHERSVLRPLPLPPLPPPFTSMIPAATLRPSKKRPRTSKPKFGDIKGNCIEALKTVCTERVHSEIRKTIERLGKRKKQSDEIYQNEYTMLRADLEGRPKLPRNTYDSVLTSLKAKGILPETALVNAVQRQLPNKESLVLWKDSIEESFDIFWEEEVKALKSKALDPPQEPVPEVVDLEEPQNSNMIKTCTMTLKQILRPDMEQHHEEITKTILKRQEEITNLADELSVLAHQTTLLIASGKLHCIGEQADGPVFDISTLLPANFELPPEFNPIIQVSPLPPNLQATIAAEAKAGKGDLLGLLSQNHLQYIYARCLAHDRSKCTSRNHPLWSQGIDLLVRSGATSNVPRTPEGLSQTIYAHIRELSTNFKVLWEGSIFTKSLDYLLRIILRLHLAPLRETKNRQRVLKAANSTSKTHTTSRSQLAYGIRKTFDDLSDILQHERLNMQRMHRTVELLVAMHGVDGMSGVEDEDLAISHEFSSFEETLNTLLALEDAQDDDEEEKLKASNSAEPSKSRLRALQAVLRTLVESPSIEHTVTVEWVRKSSFRYDEFTHEECLLVAKLANSLRPFIPKRRAREDGQGRYQESIAHVSLRAPLVMIANSILRATGYSSFTRRVAPQVSPARLRGLHMGGSALYEVLSQFTVLVEGKPITSHKEALANRQAVFAAFFDVERMERVCHQYRIRFRYKMTFVDLFTVRLIGDVIPHGPDRVGYPFNSKMDERTKDRRGSHINKWIQTFVSEGLTTDQVESGARAANSAIIKQEATVDLLRKERVDTEDQQRRAARIVSVQRHEQAPSEMQHASYMNLVQARHRNRMVARSLLPEEIKLEQLKEQRYACNKLVQAGKAIEASTSEQSSAQKRLDRTTTQRSYTTRLTTPSWEKKPTEELVQNLDITVLCQQAEPWSERKITFSGSDYGLITMSETVPVSVQRVHAHLTGYEKLINPSTPQKDAVELLKIPRSFKITAGLLHDVGFARNLMENRLQLLKQPQHEPTRLAYGTLSTAGKLMQHARTVNELKDAQMSRRTVRNTLRGFETSRSILKIRRTKNLRTKRAVQSLAAAERRYILSGAKDLEWDQPTSSMLSPTGWCSDCDMYHFINAPEDKFYRPSSECPRVQVKVLPVIIIGDSGTCVGSRIGGHLRRGGNRFRTEHARNAVVAVQDEFRTSKTCIFCFARTTLAYGRRKGEPVRIRGAVVCPNPDCVSNRFGYCIKPRDNHSALAIALAGAATLLHPEREGLPCFARGNLLPTFTSTTSTSTTTTTTATTTSMGEM
ncbi:MAG: hypothetical protein J3Q66DRAFT_306632 [Benniella sp.]|nr:MAG: hypothetical protein J3Q66DRAFT_306632 [Benniella sp.]